MLEQREAQETSARSSGLQQRDCPACGGASHSEPLSREHGYELVRCNDCRMLFTHSVQTIEAKIAHYDKLANERTDTTSVLSPAHYGLANQIKSVGLYERVLQYIVETSPEGNINFVDVGCAGGLFLLGAQAIDGYHCGVAPRFNVRGISIDPRERSETERNVGCPVLFPDEATEAWPGWADAVTLMNVLEHVCAPFELLCQLKRIQKPGGMLLIDVPNNAVVSMRGRFVGRWPELDLGEHINHFVPSTLDRLLIRAGFAPVRRFNGMFNGVESLAIKTTARSVARWTAASAIMFATGGWVQLFPHMTMAYRA